MGKIFKIEILIFLVFAFDVFQALSNLNQQNVSKNRDGQQAGHPFFRKPSRFNKRQNIYRFGQGRLNDVNAKLVSTSMGDSSKLSNNEISSIVGETLSKTSKGMAPNKTQLSSTDNRTDSGEEIVVPNVPGLKPSARNSSKFESSIHLRKPKLSPSRISSIVNHTVFKIMSNNSRDDPLGKADDHLQKPTLSLSRISAIVNHTVFKIINNISRDDPSGNADDQDSRSGSGFISCEVCPACVGCVMPVPQMPQGAPVEVLHVHDTDGNPCLHGGELREFPKGTFTCMCPIGYRGKKCGELLYCQSNPCRNNGTCIEDAYGFKCVCPKGFKGCTCDEISSCDPNPCENDGVCVEIDKSYTCACKPGYQGEKCTDADPCFTKPCKNGGTCTVITGKANCTCHAHYTGDYCQDEKVCYANPCHNGATCIEDPERPCVCAKGYAGRLCSEYVCNNNPCFNGGACEVTEVTDGADEMWTYKCKCPVFYKGKNCEVSDFCRGNPCQNSGTCVDQNRQNVLSKRWLNVIQPHAFYKCICFPGYTGKQCENDICDSCHDHAECVDHRCVCSAGYTGDGFDCTKIPSPCHPNPCRNAATCVVGPDLSYDCKCHKGYCGEHCDLICDVCALKPCMNGGSCFARGEGRYCVCPPEFTGPDCNIRFPDLCQPNPCLHDFACKYQKEKHDYVCDCKGKFSGKNCQNCDCPKAMLIPGKQTYDSLCDAVGECYCPEVDGVFLTYNEKKGCVSGKSATLCSPNPCLNGGTCLIKGYNEEYCECKSPYYGDRCQYRFCEVSNPCQNGGTCVDIGVKDYKCRCTPGYTGENCTVPAPEPVIETLCYPSPCLYGGTCKERGNGYDCLCFIRYTGPNCEVDRCADCDVNADCVDGHCLCRYGYTGTGYVCERDENECGVCPTDNHCVSGQCECIPGITCVANK